MAQNACLQHTLEAGMCDPRDLGFTFVPRRSRRALAALAASLGVEVAAH
jgi:hypothetical protein